MKKRIFAICLFFITTSFAVVYGQEVHIESLDEDFKAYHIQATHYVLKSNADKEAAAKKYATLDFINDAYYDQATNEVVLITEHKQVDRLMIEYLDDFDPSIKTIDQLIYSTNKH